MKVKTFFYLKRFDVSLLRLRFSVQDTHLKIFFTSIYNKIVVI